MEVIKVVACSIRPFALLGMIVGIVFPTFGASQSSPTISILSPQSGTVVQAGQVVQIVVSTTNASLLSGEFVVGQGPIRTSSIQLPATQLTFSVQIPATTSPGTYFVSAVGGLVQGGITDQTAASSVALVVPIRGIVSALRADLSTLILDYAGKQIPIVTTATTNNGSFTVPAEQLAFISKNPTIASVAANGVVTGQAPGQTQITISYSNGNPNISTLVNVQVRGSVHGDLNGDGKVDTDDVNILDAAFNTPANGPNDARDLNHDGIINALDAEILTSLCTYPECATRSGSSLTIGAASASPNVLWPPNHKMVPVTLTVPTSGGSGAVSCSIAWVSSNEPIDPGGDWMITGSLTLNLVADRLGTGTGRVYTIEVECRDSLGNSVAKSVLVNVPHDQGH